MSFGSGSAIHAPVGGNGVQSFRNQQVDIVIVQIEAKPGSYNRR